MDVVFANCKINLSLAIIARRSDWYHNLLSLNVPLSLCDRITVAESDCDRFVTNDARLARDNTVVRAVSHMKRYVDKNFCIELEKNIPTMAGFGGGSSDAAAILKFFNGRYELGFDGKVLREIALLFGADCPFFIGNKPAIVGGIGEDVVELGDKFCTNLSRYNVLLFKPNFGVSTEEAYRQLRSRPDLYIGEGEARDLLNGLIAGINNFDETLPLFNTFSEIVFNAHRELAVLLERLPCPMMLSGSGSGCFCIFRESGLADEIVTIIRTQLGAGVFIERSAILA